MANNKDNIENGLQYLEENSYLSGGNMSYLEEMYEEYLKNPTGVPDEWRELFVDLPSINGVTADISHAQVREEFLKRAKSQKYGQILFQPTNLATIEKVRKQVRVQQLIEAYRHNGHKAAKLDPLGVPRPSVPDLELASYDFDENDLDTIFTVQSYAGLSEGRGTLREVVAALNQTYCSTLGFEYMYISDPQQINWWQQRIEPSHAKVNLPREKKLELFDYLVAAEGLEKYLGSRFVGQKRFSVEGGESFVPLMNELIQRAGSQGVKEIVIGMAHRGRLNILVNIFGKAPAQLFSEFEGKHATTERSGDVKYHMGYSSNIETTGGPVHIALGFNPSHLEIISPVVEGSVRCRQDRRKDLNCNRVVPVLIHGDASFAGQGVVMETMNMSQTRGYKTGGTVHIIINNQIGFTTSCPEDARSTRYCSDLAKMFESPVIHVNGDDPESVLLAIQLAFDFRMEFNQDVVVDLVCYRRHGHNESDEPAITQPGMYNLVRQKPTVLTLYAEKLEQQGIIAQDTLMQKVMVYRNSLDAGHPVVEKLLPDTKALDFYVDWTPFIDHSWTENTPTTIAASKLKDIAKRMLTIPANFSLQKQVAKEIESREKMAEGEIPCNWGYAEVLAYATLLEEGYAVRISGQDCGRGTFSHRHAVLHDYNTDETYIPLAELSEHQGRFSIYDSLLSEEAVLGFEYGYSTADPNSLVIWEAQFGDFVNGAQVVIDQFISSGEQKWGRLCGLVMLLPHGYEGMGPEHTSARPERFLQLCAQENIQVCIPTTPAQCFHMLRRQMIRPYRKPLVVMTPKSLLRHKMATSSLKELEEGEFQVVIPEVDAIQAENVRRVVLCSGKVYYDLLEYRRTQDISNVAIIRVEQLYPFPTDILKAQLSSYKNAKEVVWCQEEAKNQGAWYSCKHNIKGSLDKGQKLYYAGRTAAAAPAVGYLSRHIEEQEALVIEALKSKVNGEN